MRFGPSPAPQGFFIVGPSPMPKTTGWRESLQQNIYGFGLTTWNLGSLQIFCQPILENPQLIVYPKVCMIIDIHPINCLIFLLAAGWVQKVYSRLQFPSEYQAFTKSGSDMQSAGFFRLQRVVKTTCCGERLLVDCCGLLAFPPQGQMDLVRSFLVFPP